MAQFNATVSSIQPLFDLNSLSSLFMLKGETQFQPLLLDVSYFISFFGLFVSVVLGYVVYENFLFAWNRAGKKGSLPGPAFVTPIIGTIWTMVMNPYQYWEDQKKYSFPGMSWTSILGKFTVFVTDAKIQRNLLQYNDEDTLLMAVHPSGRNILGDSNLAFMHGPDHKAIRKSFLALFTRKALAKYIEIQDKVIWKHLRFWMEEYDGKPREMRNFIRDMNAETSQEVFAGPYLMNQVEREQFSNAFKDMTLGFLAFPICLPGTQVWKGKQGRLYIVGLLTKAAEKSKQLMKNGQEPKCLMDYWALQVLKEEQEATEQGTEPPKHATPSKMADTIMDFLFASQDASSASLAWVFALMADHPDVLEKVREEQTRLRGDDLSAPVNGEVLSQMTYTRQVVRELLRFRPPAPMIPQLAQKPFKLTEDYTAPAGTLILPSLMNASLQGYSNPEQFNPDRFNPGNDEDKKFGRYFLTFGHGPHRCVGQEYATQHLVCFLAILSMAMEWNRVKGPDSDKYTYLPTIYPRDTIVSLRWRDKSMHCQ
eukprot:TRINITY_DN11346_c0_g1_i2.p1 TRINITY_DN11346_c0_g1~~TRINITY_DN11346_c0_g1_i2.p1  ORF type:complete len:538 (-),score=42.28 TRINITY_DN11346_c0_g1_i2:444-2057(-)